MDDPSNIRSTAASEHPEDSLSGAQSGARSSGKGPTSAQHGLDAFEAWRATQRSTIVPVDQLALERARQADQLASSRAKLSQLAAALELAHAPPEEPAQLLELESKAAHKRKGVVLPSGRVDRSALAQTLNEESDPRVAKVIAQARELVAEEDREAAKQPRALAPHRRGQRPVSKHDTQQTKIHREARVMAKAIVNSRGAYVIQSYLFKLRPIFSGQPLAYIRNAALQPMIDGYRYTYADDIARRRIAEGLVLLCIGKWGSLREAFGSRSTRRGLIVAGVPAHWLLQTVTPVFRRRYERHTWGAGSSGADAPAWRGDCATFEQYGFLMRRRLPVSRLNAWEIGDSGQGMNRYFIPCVVSDRSPKREARNRGSMIATVFGAMQLDPCAHDAGWNWADEIPSYAPTPERAPP